MDYTKYDYNALVDTITTRLANAEGWGEGYQSTTGQLLIQLFADTTDSLTYMLEMRAQESFLSTARLQSSIFAHASEIGYRPRRAVSMTGELTITLEDQSGNPKNAVADVVIPKNTKVSLIDPPIDFVTTDDVTVVAGSSTATLPVKEGVFESKTFDATVEPFLSDRDAVISDYRFIDEYSLSVYDDFDVYFDVDSNDGVNETFGALAYANPTTTAYDVKYAREGMRIVFGDGIFGKTPEGTLTVEYVRSQQETKSILNTGLEFELDDEILYDISGTIPLEEYRYTIVNSTPITGFLNPETTASIAKNAPIFASTNKRAVIPSDYEYWTKRSGIGGIVDANAYGEQELGSLIFNMNNVFVTYATTDLTDLTLTQETQYRDYMDRLKTATTHIVIQPARELNVILDVYLKKNTRIPAADEEIYKYIKNKLEEYFAIEDGSIGKDLQHSELVEFLQNLEFSVGNINYPVTDFVRVDIVAEYPLPSPLPTLVYDIRMKLDSSYAIQINDIWTVLIDGNPTSVTVQSGDTHEILAERMRAAISNDTSFATELYEQDGHQYVRILSPNNTVFDIDVSTGDLAPFVSTNKITDIPKSTVNNTGSVDLVVPGSVTIVDSSENVIFQDDGNGLLVPSSGQPIPIDYKNVTLSDLYYPDTNETYFIRFSQDEYSNVYISQRGVLALSPIAAFGDPELKSSITLI